ncbi:MAG: carboxypeptidase-like regulatory domain-containing protein [Saprospiraceae bacterium]
MSCFKLFLVLIIGISTGSLFSQTYTLSGSVVNSESARPIPFATLYLVQQEKGTYANEEGKFIVTFDAAPDQLIISAVGYQSDTIMVNAANVEDLTIVLKPTDYVLETVEIIGERKQLKRFDLGFWNKKYKEKLDWYYSYGDQMAVYIQNEVNKQGVIETINFKTEKYDLFQSVNEHNIAIRMKLWSYDPYTELPGKSLLKEDVIVHIDKVKNTNYSINILAQNIEFPLEGLFVGIEFLGDPSKDPYLQFRVGPGISFVLAPKPTVSYYNKFGYRDWIDVSKKYKRLEMPKIGLTLIQY